MEENVKADKNDFFVRVVYKGQPRLYPVEAFAQKFLEELWPILEAWLRKYAEQLEQAEREAGNGA